MQTETEKAFSWVRQIPGDLFQLDEKPLLGFPPAFPWSDFAAHIGRSLQIEGFSLQPGEWQWRLRDELSSGMGPELRGIPFTLAPIPGSLWWAMPATEIERLMAFVLAKETAIPAGAIDTDFLRSFYRFLAIEAINAFQKVDFDKKISPSIGQDEGLPTDHCLCLDVAMTLQQETFHGRLFLSTEFRKAWAQRNQQSNLFSLSPLADSLDVIIHLEAGKVNLRPSEWRQIRSGDFLFLDNCSLDPDEDKGRVMLVVNGVPLFRGKIKQGSIKILEHPLYHEVDTVMTNPPPEDEEGEEEFSDTSFDDEDFDNDLEEESETHTEETSLSDELTDEDLEGEEEKPPAPEKPIKKAPAKTAKKVTLTPEKAPPGPTMAIDEIPLHVVVEVGRVQMSIKKLLELQPGNMLELDIHPEAGVDMVVNGKRIAHGELLRIGDALGVRILELS